MKSDSMKEHIKKNEFMERLKSMDKDDLDRIEFNIAEKIINQY